MKTKIAALVAAVGGLCALCCVLPIAGFIGLGALEAFFCDNPYAIWMGVGLMVVGFGALGYRLWKWTCGTVGSCDVSCRCKAIVVKAAT
jgi:hypothetical protein